MSLWKAFKARKYPTKVIILEVRQTGLRYKEDKGQRRENKNGEVSYHLLYGGKTTKPIPRESAVATTQSGADVIILYSPCDKSYYPLSFDKTTRSLKGIDEDLKQWVAADEARTIQKWQTKKDAFMKYLPIITLVVMALSIVIIMYGAWTYGMKQIVETFSQVSGQMVEASKNLAMAGKQVIG